MNDSLNIHVSDVQLKAAYAGIGLGSLRKAIPELESLANAKIEAAERYDEAVTVQAINCGIIKGVLNQFIQARVTDTVQKKAQSASQLNLLFGEDI